MEISFQTESRHPTLTSVTRNFLRQRRKPFQWSWLLLSPASVPAEQTAFPVHLSLNIEHSRLRGPFNIEKKDIKFSAGFEGGMKANNSEDRKLLKINHMKREMWHNSPCTVTEINCLWLCTEVTCKNFCVLQHFGIRAALALKHNEFNTI